MTRIQTKVALVGISKLLAGILLWYVNFWVNGGYSSSGIRFSKAGNGHAVPFSTVNFENAV